MKWALSTALKSSKMDTADSGLDMTSSRPKGPEGSQKVSCCGHRLLEPRDQAGLGHVELHDQQTAALPMGA